MSGSGIKTEKLTLRQKAEELHKTKDLLNNVQPSEIETLKLVHKLEVYQIELEIQNKELMQAISAAQDAVDLYDFAPSGFFTLSTTGEIIALNLCGAKMLGNER